jgi:hypothetical protein
MGFLLLYYVSWLWAYLPVDVLGRRSETFSRPNARMSDQKVLGHDEQSGYAVGIVGVRVQIASAASIFNTNDSLSVKL